MKTTSYAQQGDFFNQLGLGMTVVYTSMVVLSSDRPGLLLDEKWVQDGFCVSDTPIGNSHDLSFYVDVVLASILLTLYALWRNIEGLEEASKLIPIEAVSILGHGAVHEFIAYKMRQGKSLEDEAESPPLLSSLIFAVVFWFPFLKAALSNWNLGPVMVSALLASYFQRFVPPRFGFTYVQTVLVCASALNSMLSADRNNREYAYRAISLIPVVLVPFFECMTCQSFLKHVGGHAVFDGTLALMSIFFYAACYADQMSLQKKKTA
jgi:hypothetical protein